ncbi:hypothetical protein B0H10DRAFT_72505 [Mycena sp. CBHHK59/15]|nr:hypothetical protein B0H10DRAFT_72505 [Mycena sp. CBHHK59/15]
MPDCFLPDPHWILTSATFPAASYRLTQQHPAALSSCCWPSMTSTNFAIDNVNPLIQYSPSAAWTERSAANDPLASSYSNGGTFSLCTTQSMAHKFGFLARNGAIMESSCFQVLSRIVTKCFINWPILG